MKQQLTKTSFQFKQQVKTGRGKEMGDVCREEIVENNGNKTKDLGVEGTEGEDRMRNKRN